MQCVSLRSVLSAVLALLCIDPLHGQSVKNFYSRLYGSWPSATKTGSRTPSPSGQAAHTAVPIEEARLPPGQAGRSYGSYYSQNERSPEGATSGSSGSYASTLLARLQAPGSSGHQRGPSPGRQRPRGRGPPPRRECPPGSGARAGNPGRGLGRGLGGGGGHQQPQFTDIPPELAARLPSWFFSPDEGVKSVIAGEGLFLL